MEGEVSREHEVEDDSEAKGVDLVVVVLRTVYFGSDEARSPRKLFLGGQILELVLEDSEPEVDQLHPVDYLLLLADLDLS